MGFFSRTPKPDLKLSFEGIEFTVRRDEEWWEFTYQGVEFSSFSTKLVLPAKAELDSILGTITSLKPEMRKRLAEELSAWEGTKLDDGESYYLDVKDYVTDKSFIVTWCDGASWGDLGVDFTIKDGVIVDESWGD